jgi:MFS family permease
VEQQELQDEITSIRSLMERSSKFISLSGLSGVLAGVYALVGSAIAWFIIQSENSTNIWEGIYNYVRIINALVIIAIVVLFASIITALLLSIKKAKKRSQPIWNSTSRSLLFNMSIPLLTGGALITLFLSQGYVGFVVPTSLIFYGLALVSASNFTFADVKYLGICEVLLGLITACLPEYGLLLWALGFGLLHIIYGSVMYFKYDR